MDIADSICRFLVTPPNGQLSVEEWVTNTLESEKRRKIKSVYKVERHEALEVVLNLYEPLVCCLEEIKDSTDWNHAQSHLLALTRFPFVFSLVVTKEVLGYTKALGIKLSICRCSQSLQ